MNIRERWLHLQLSGKELMRLEELAEEDGLGVDDYVRQLLNREYKAAQESFRAKQMADAQTEQTKAIIQILNRLTLPRVTVTEEGDEG